MEIECVMGKCVEATGCVQPTDHIDCAARKRVQVRGGGGLVCARGMAECAA